ncbi:hypothetical protein [Halapricum desulfuricans]|uniref:hypothetical protein n=1 Tax=Halapricum desulfuricans TaxID=2841257 RepID=UPI001E4609C7|nr:hypothetical protein [Halapricum desulfuricans]
MGLMTVEEAKEKPIVESVERHVECGRCGKEYQQESTENESCPECGQEAEWERVEDVIALNTENVCNGAEIGSIEDLHGELQGSATAIHALNAKGFRLSHNPRPHKPVLRKDY